MSAVVECREQGRQLPRQRVQRAMEGAPSFVSMMEMPAGYGEGVDFATYEGLWSFSAKAARRATHALAARVRRAIKSAFFFVEFLSRRLPAQRQSQSRQTRERCRRCFG